MKPFTLLLALIFSLQAFPQSAPPSVKGQQDSAYQRPKPNLQFPNQSVTNLGGLDSLVETGNNNLLANPSFEHSTFNTGWTCTGVTPVVETTVVAPGSKKSMKLVASASTFECYQDSTIGASQAASVQFLAMMRIKAALTAGTVKVCPRQAGVVATSYCNSSVDDTFNYRKAAFSGSTTSNGISIIGTSATGTIYLDDGFVGAVDLKADGVKVTQQGSAVRQNATFGAATITGATTSTDGSGLYSYNSSTGVYTVLKKALFTINASMRASSTTQVIPSIYIDSIQSGFDNSTSIGSAWASTSFSGIINAGSTFYAMNSANSTDSQIISVTATENLNGSTYSSTNADTNWAACNFSTLTWSGLGNVTSGLRCKREGSDLKIMGYFTAGTVGVAEAQIPLPLWNGAALSTSSTMGAVGVTAGRITRQIASVQNDYTGIIWASQSVIRISSMNSTGYFPLSGQAGNAIYQNTETSAVNLSIPIDGWENSNVIIAQINGLESCTDTYQCTDTYSFKASASSGGVSTVSDENIDWIIGNGTYNSPVGSSFNFAVKAGLFTVKPNCSVIPGAFTRRMAYDLVNSTPTNLAFVQSNSSDAVTNDASFSIMCQKQGVDFIGKTAKAVASDQATFGPLLTWQNVTASRALATTYTNNTGRPIIIGVATTAGGLNAINGNINGITMAVSSGGNASFAAGITMSIPNGSTYSITVAAGSPTLATWYEYR